MPLPLSLTLFKGAPSAAAAGLPTIGAGTAAGTSAAVGGGAVATKIAVGLAAVAVAGGAGYEGVKAVQAPPQRATPVVKVIPRSSERAATRPAAVVAVTPHAVVATPKPAALLKPTMVKKVAAGEAGTAVREADQDGTRPQHRRTGPDEDDGRGDTGEREPEACQETKADARRCGTEGEVEREDEGQARAGKHRPRSEAEGGAGRDAHAAARASSRPGR